MYRNNLSTVTTLLQNKWLKTYVDIGLLGLQVPLEPTLQQK